MCKNGRLLLAFGFIVALSLVGLWATSASAVNDSTAATAAREGGKFQALPERVDATDVTEETEETEETERLARIFADVLERVAETEATEPEAGARESNEKSSVASRIFVWLCSAIVYIARLFLKLTALFFAWLGSMIFSGSPLKVWTAIILTLLAVAFIQFAGLRGDAESFYANAPYVSYKAIACCATIMALSPLFPQAFKLLPFPDEIIPIDTMDIDSVQAFD